MSLLPPVLVRDIGDEVPQAEKVIYDAFIRHLESGASPLRAQLRAANDCGVSRVRVAEVIRAHNRAEDVFLVA